MPRTRQKPLPRVVGRLRASVLCKGLSTPRSVNLRDTTHPPASPSELPLGPLPQGLSLICARARTPIKKFPDGSGSQGCRRMSSAHLFTDAPSPLRPSMINSNLRCKRSRWSTNLQPTAGPRCGKMVPGPTATPFGRVLLEQREKREERVVKLLRKERVR